jgi:chemotaxis protein MotB
MKMRRKRGGGEESKGGAPEWLATYGDMTTLLLCFFVLLYSFSNLDAQKYNLLRISLREALGVLDGGKTLDSGALIEGGEVYNEVSRFKEDELFEEIVEKLEDSLGKENFAEIASFVINERGLTIRFLDSVLFDTGQANLKPEAKEILDKLADILSQYPSNPIRVEGHTDNVPIHNSRFPSNWELSTARATTVIRHLIDRYNFSPDKLSAAGYGEYKPVASNDTVEGRRLNRRVDIVILRSDSVLQEPN